MNKDNNYLIHWKYKKKLRMPNGKYRYYYDTGFDGIKRSDNGTPKDYSDDKYYNSSGEKLNSEYRETYRGLLSGTNHILVGDERHGTIITERNIGAIEALSNEGKKWFNKMFGETKTKTILDNENKTITLKTHTKGEIEKYIDKGKQWLDDLFD